MDTEKNDSRHPFRMFLGYRFSALRMRDHPCCAPVDSQRHAAVYRHCVYDGRAGHQSGRIYFHVRAFQAQPEMAISRMVLAFVASAFIGLWASRGVHASALRNTVNNANEQAAADKNNIKPPHSNKAPNAAWKTKLHETLEHAAIEMFDVGKYLVLGATVTALLQTVVSKKWLLALSDGDWTPHLFMMGLSYVLSICSTADSFVGATFIPDFSLGAVLAFLVFGAMLDIKSTLMLLKVFRFKTVATVLIISAVVVLLGAVAFDQLYMHL
ncbi:permease [Paenibacillus sp. SM 69]|nr:permease [Paenibacillus oleatilyticus]MBU7317996.1 permease [Paenibacillus oleatilyticus]